MRKLRRARPHPRQVHQRILADQRQHQQLVDVEQKPQRGDEANQPLGAGEFQLGSGIRGRVGALEEAVTRGQFSMVLQASWREGQLQPAELRKGLNALGRELGMEMRMRLSEPGRKQRMAIMVTREAACPEALLAAFKKGQLKKAEPMVVISNRPDLERLTKKYKLPFVHIPWNDRQRAEKKALRILEKHEVDFVVLARFMKILSPDFVWRYKNKIINIHPSLLPSFPGPQAYRQAYEHGVKIIGVTAHFVSMHLDEGPVIAQESFNVNPGWTLKRIVAE